MRVSTRPRQRERSETEQLRSKMELLRATAQGHYRAAAELDKRANEIQSLLRGEA